MVTSDVKRRDPEHYLFERETSTGGFFNWLACHYLDLLLYVTGERITAVTARTGNFGATDIEVEDGGVVILDLSGGGIATFIGGYWMPRWAGEAQWTIRGSERWVHWDPGRGRNGRGTRDPRPRNRSGMLWTRPFRCRSTIPAATVVLVPSLLYATG